MRRALLLTAVLAACATNEAPESDSAAAVSEDHAMLQPADVSGTWTGSTMPLEGDSVVSRWTIVTVDETTAHLML